ncbi:XTP/dITP diphosphatase [Pediococcus pentosaceus]|jgi:XTP/dITP diphosphohydrolase|uniref:dITP/XTP pyrophosphatase n=3 Tax=Pediococcus pentosaceus TaxID=1255 RepID=A0A0R2H8U6_PEDPE|nr:MULTISPECIES: XTP/dITP diphosphatase [Pediococcus]ABJ68297.1 Xanthosine triphosphate pyrophosphatase [Pediococcus pentosaceus ATCC 25745]ANI97682.1 non-canonical purine NTP pyrophosphatase, RdgB/HAM1 family [Pediococcus pentosaceus]ARW19425.1 XTP/dITP diphosphatase [Pediococcus pentosaceus]ASC08192.1 XTP/dITP diphosphatase [Pediococcus pentosaceus]AVL01732.1 non-canonical purine NTP pyrophosphatase [Pediococcus pentosaceus]
MNNEILIATKNDGKLKEFKQIFEQKGIVVKSLKDINDDVEIVENGLSFEENARLKADGYAKSIGIPVLADDSGLEIDALNGRPGIFSARYAGDHNDAANNAKVLSELGGIPDEKRTATFHSTVVVRKPDGSELVANGNLRGRILAVPRGDNGFGYDPLFFVEAKNKTLAEMTREEKNKISHRALAIEDLLVNFDKFWE